MKQMQGQMKMKINGLSVIKQVCTPKGWKLKKFAKELQQETVQYKKGVNKDVLEFSYGTTTSYKDKIKIILNKDGSVTRQIYSSRQIPFRPREGHFRKTFCSFTVDKNGNKTSSTRKCSYYAGSESKGILSTEINDAVNPEKSLSHTFKKNVQKFKDSNYKMVGDAKPLEFDEYSQMVIEMMNQAKDFKSVSARKSAKTDKPLCLLRWFVLP